MKTPERVEKKIIHLITCVFFMTGIFSRVTQAQSPVSESSNQSTGKIKNAETRIRQAPEFSLTAKAVPMNSAVNSPYVELKPAFVPGGTRLYFSRVSHPDNTYREFDNEDIWFADYDTVSDSWSDPAVLPGVLNNKGPNYINSVSVTGDTIILGNQYLKKGKMRAGLSYSVNMQGEWSVPKSIVIKNDYNISTHAHHYVSLKRGVIISAVQRVETEGKRDLYVSFWDGQIATEPVNMGSVINSGLDESSPFLASDTKTLFFASKGHNGHGGFDIFVTTRLDDTWTNWSEPRNLGPAVNGVLDDEHFIITHCKKYALFSKQISVHNIDLFRISIEELYQEIGNTMQQKAPVKKERPSLASL